LDKKGWPQLTDTNSFPFFFLIDYVPAGSGATEQDGMAASFFCQTRKVTFCNSKTPAFALLSQVLFCNSKTPAIALPSQVLCT